MNDVVQQDDVLVLELLHKRDLADGRRRGALLRIEVDLLQRYQLARLAVTAFEHLHSVRLYPQQEHQQTHSGIGTLAQLLQLLERAGVSPIVHGRDGGDVLAAAEVAHADGAVGAVEVGNGECARVRRLERAWGRSCSVVAVPENGSGGGELVCDAQLGGGRGGGALV